MLAPWTIQKSERVLEKREGFVGAFGRGCIKTGLAKAITLVSCGQCRRVFAGTTANCSRCTAEGAECVLTFSSINALSLASTS